MYDDSTPGRELYMCVYMHVCTVCMYAVCMLYFMYVLVVFTIMFVHGYVCTYVIRMHMHSIYFEHTGPDSTNSIAEICFYQSYMWSLEECVSE